MPSLEEEFMSLFSPSGSFKAGSVSYGLGGNQPTTQQTLQMPQAPVVQSDPGLLAAATEANQIMSQPVSAPAAPLAMVTPSSTVATPTISNFDQALQAFNKGAADPYTIARQFNLRPQDFAGVVSDRPEITALQTATGNLFQQRSAAPTIYEAIDAVKAGADPREVIQSLYNNPTDMIFDLNTKFSGTPQDKPYMQALNAAAKRLYGEQTTAGIEQELARRFPDLAPSTDVSKIYGQGAGSYLQNLYNSIIQRSKDIVAGGGTGYHGWNTGGKEVKELEEMAGRLKEKPGAMRVIDEIVRNDPNNPNWTPGNLLTQRGLINNYLSEYDRIGPYYATRNFINDAQNLVGIGKDDWFASHSMENPEWANLQKIKWAMTPTAPNDIWEKKVYRSNANTKYPVVSLWRDPETGNGIAIKSRDGKKNDGFTFIDKFGDSMFTSSYSAPEVLKSAEKVGMSIPSLASFNEVVKNSGVNVYDNDYADLARGGLGTPYDWRIDPNVGRKGPSAQQQLEENRRLAKRFGLQPGSKQPSSQFQSYLQQLLSPVQNPLLSTSQFRPSQTPSLSSGGSLNEALENQYREYKYGGLIG
jgi:hypothetical protein